MKKIISLILCVGVFGIASVFGNSDEGGDFQAVNISESQKTAVNRVITEYEKQIQILQKSVKEHNQMVGSVIQENNELKELVIEYQKQASATQQLKEQFIEKKAKILQLEIQNNELLASQEVTGKKIVEYYTLRLMLFVTELIDMGGGGLFIGVICILFGMIFLRAIVLFITFPVSFFFRKKEYNQEIYKKGKLQYSSEPTIEKEGDEHQSFYSDDHHKNTFEYEEVVEKDIPYNNIFLEIESDIEILKNEEDTREEMLLTTATQAVAPKKVEKKKESFLKKDDKSGLFSKKKDTTKKEAGFSLYSKGRTGMFN